MKKYLFLFTISPVQAFIAQARKTQDLYAGSKLLSDLVKHSITKFLVQTRLTKDAIRFPANYDDKDAALPNRFLAELEIKENDAHSLGKVIENAVLEKFKEIANNLFNNKVKNEKDKRKINEQFNFQIENHLIIHWLFEPLEGKSYKEAYKNIESNMGAIKNLRTFKQLPDFEQGRKDSMTGELNALFFNKKFGKLPAFTENTVKIKASGIQLSQGEGLSAVSFVKRFYLDKEFPSTAEIACLNTIKIINESNEYKNYTGLFNGNFDEQLLYEENLNPLYFYKQGLIDLLGTTEATIEGEIKMNKTIIEVLNKHVNNKLEKFKDAYKILKKKLKEEKLKFNKYYAILVFDGDDMGKWLSGEYLGEAKKDDEKLKKYHTELSKILAGFAKKAQEYVDDNKYGKTIYAGGDDFMALLNLDNIFDTITELRNMFDKQVNQELKKEFPQINETDNLTFSAGLTIAHYKEPLGEVLNRARSMEQKAKQITSKNALAISVMKHSGEMQKAVVKWGENIANISDILKALNEKQFSPSFIENMNKEFLIFEDEQKTKMNNLLPIIEIESQRLIQRAYTGAKENKKEQTKDISSKIYSLFANSRIINSSSSGILNFIEILNIIDFLYRKA